MRRWVQMMVSLLAVAITVPRAARALNEVRVYVPPQNGLAEQELQVGVAADIYVSIVTDTLINGIEIPLAIRDLGDGTLWPPIADTQLTFLIDTSIFIVHSFFGIWQDGIWPDTIEVLLVGNYLPPGSYELFKITVTPTASGTVQWSAPEFTVGGGQHQLAFCTPPATCFEPKFSAPEISVLAGDCNGNGIGDDQDIASGTSSDCNGNNRPDECDLADSTSEDYNQNRVPDECEGWPANAVLVYVPPATDHGPQELVVGRPGEIRVASITDSIVNTVEVPLELVETAGGSPWPPIADTQVTFLTESGGFLLVDFFDLWQDGVWPDTIDAIFVSGELPPGIHDLMTLSVTPLESGLVHFNSASFVAGGFHQLQFCPQVGSCLVVGLVAEDINVLDPSTCCFEPGNVDHFVGAGGPVDVNDLTYLAAFLFLGGPPPVCAAEGNLDGVIGVGGAVDVADLIYLVAYLFLGGQPPMPCP